MTGKGGTFFARDFSFIGLVAFVADEDKDGLCALDADHVLSKDLEAVKCGSRGDGVDEDKSLSLSNPLIAEGRILLLTGGVYDFYKAQFLIDDHLFAIGIFNRRVIRLDKAVESKLDGEGSLSNTSITKNGYSPLIHGF